MNFKLISDIKSESECDIFVRVLSKYINDSNIIDAINNEELNR